MKQINATYRFIVHVVNASGRSECHTVSTGLLVLAHCMQCSLNIQFSTVSTLKTLVEELTCSAQTRDITLTVKSV